MEIKINNLWAVVGIDIDGNPIAYARIFINKEQAEDIAKRFDMKIQPVFIMKIQPVFINN